MILEDTTAFIERLQIELDDKRTDKRRRRVGAARAAMLKCQWDVSIAIEYLGVLEAQAMTDRSVHREMKSVRSFATRKQQKLRRRGTQLKRLEEELERLGAGRRNVFTFRLHSAEHVLDCSEERFRELEERQLATPVLLAKNKGRRWWWHSDRFWWDDARLSARELREAVRDVDVIAAFNRHLVDETRARTFLASTDAVEGIPDGVRLAVWRANGGCCADCGSRDDLCFTSATSQVESVGASPDELAAAGTTLLCRTCAEIPMRPGWRVTLGQDTAA